MRDTFCLTRRDECHITLNFITVSRQRCYTIRVILLHKQITLCLINYRSRRANVIDSCQDASRRRTRGKYNNATPQPFARPTRSSSSVNYFVTDTNIELYR